MPRKLPALSLALVLLIEPAHAERPFYEPAPDACMMTAEGAGIVGVCGGKVVRLTCGSPGCSVTFWNVPRAEMKAHGKGKE